MTTTAFPRKDATDTIYFSATAMQRLFDGGAYLRAAFNFVTVCNLVPSTFTNQFPAYTMTEREDFVFVFSFICASLLEIDVGY